MARNEDAHRRLAELLRTRNLTGATVDDLVEALKAAIVEQEDRAEFIRRSLAELNRKGLTFDQIAQQVGISRSKANRLARKSEE